MVVYLLFEEVFEIVVIKILGDKIQDCLFFEVGGKGLFIKEIEEVMFDYCIDLVVYLLKDMLIVLFEGLVLIVFLLWEDVCDVFFLLKVVIF